MGDPPAGGGVDELVVVVARRAHARAVVRPQHEGLHVAAGHDPVLAGGHRDVGDPVEGVAARVVDHGHPLGDLVDPVPDADLAVVGLAVLGEAGAEQVPVPPVDPGRIPDEHVGYVLPDLPVHGPGGVRHGAGRRPR
jgi:hypothetical protein